MKQAFPIDAVRASVRRLMDENGDKPKPLALKLGLSETGIRDIFLEKTKSVNGPKLRTLAEHYGVTVEDIMSGTATTMDKRPTLMIPLQLPNSEVLLNMCRALLSVADEADAPDERAQRLAHSFPAIFQSHLSQSGQQVADSGNNGVARPRAGDVGQPKHS